MDHALTAIAMIIGVLAGMTFVVALRLTEIRGELKRIADAAQTSDKHIR